MSDLRERGVPVEGQILPESQRLLHQMLVFKLIKFGEFQTAIHRDFPEAPKPLVSFDIRDAQGSVSLNGLVGKALAAEIKRLQMKGIFFDGLSGVPNAMPPYTNTLAERVRKPHFTPRLEPKAIGVGRRVAGLFDRHKGKTVLLIDDVYSSGGSKESAYRVLTEEGLKVTDLFVLLDRSNGNAKERMRKLGLRFHAAFTMDDLLDEALNASIINVAQRREAKERQQQVNDWIKQNAA